MAKQIRIIVSYSSQWARKSTLQYMVWLALKVQSSFYQLLHLYVILAKKRFKKIFNVIKNLGLLVPKSSRLNCNEYFIFD